MTLRGRRVLSPSCISQPPTGGDLLGHAQEIGARLPRLARSERPGWHNVGQRVSPFASKWISGTGEVITHVRGDYIPVWRKQEVRGLRPTPKRVCYRNVCVQVLLNSSPAVLAFLNTHKTRAGCSMRDCLTCSLADLAKQHRKAFLVTLHDVL